MIINRKNYNQCDFLQKKVFFSFLKEKTFCKKHFLKSAEDQLNIHFIHTILFFLKNIFLCKKSHWS